MNEMHRGICGMHSRARSLVTKVLRTGYYWPTMRKDCTEYVKKCEKVSNFWHHLSLTCRGTAQHNGTMALCCIGSRHTQPFPTTKRASAISPSRNKPIHQMDRGRTHSHILTIEIRVCWFVIPKTLISDNRNQSL